MRDEDARSVLCDPSAFTDLFARCKALQARSIWLSADARHMSSHLNALIVGSTALIARCCAHDEALSAIREFRVYTGAER